MKKRLRRGGRPPERPEMAMRKMIVVGAGALALAIAALAPAHATPQPAGPCSVNATPQNAQAVRQACSDCLAPLYPRPPQPPVTPYESNLIQWNCGVHGAADPADTQYLQGAPGYHQP